LPMARWLGRRFPSDVEIVWRGFTEQERLQESLVLLLHRLEHDAWSDEGGLGWRRWLDGAKAGRKLTDLQVILELFEGAALDEETRDWLFESLGLEIEWHLHGGRGASRTFARLPGQRPFFHRDGEKPALRHPHRDEFLREVKRPLPSLRRAPRAL